jgi:hypothetical protein
VPIPKTPEEAAAHIAGQATKRAAVITLVGVLVSVVLSTGASIFISDRTADSAANTMQQQLSGETNRSRAEFLRGKRQVLYSTIVAHEVGISEAEHKLVNDIEKTRRHNLSTDRLWAQYAKLERDEPPAKIVASPPARAQLAALTATQNSARSHFKLMSLKGEVDEDSMDWTSRYEDKREKAFDAFCQAARKDMGSE